MGLYRYIRTGNEDDFNEDDTDYDIGLIENNTYECERCGAIFVLGDAIAIFEDHFNGDLTYQDFWEILCGECAINDIENKILKDS